MKNKIDSPYTKGKAYLQSEKRNADFRNEKFHYIHFFYKCEKSNLTFTTPELGDLNINQIYNQYRQLKNIPSVDQISNLRKKYGLSASLMSSILGFGANTYGNYEKGEIPTEANGEILRIANDPEAFRDLFLKYKIKEIRKNLQSNLHEQIEKLIEKRERRKQCFGSAWNLWNDEKIPEEFTGFRAPQFNKFANLALYCIDHSTRDMFPTRLNKLLFYSDFFHYKNTGFSITGATYHANRFGTVPIKSQIAFSIMIDKGMIEAVPVFENEHGEPVAKLNALKKCDKTYFSESEYKSMEMVLKTFDKFSTKELVDLNHKEKAWSELVEGFHKISYQEYAFDLKAI